MDEIVNEFVAEGRAALVRMANDLVALETEPNDQARIASAFRAVHNVKATAGFLGFSALESVTHTGEDLLSRIRAGKLEVSKEVIDALLAIADASGEIFSSIAESGTEGTPDETPVPRNETPPADTTIRVDVRVLDELMDIASALTLTHNDLAREAAETGSVRDSVERLGQLSSTLREVVVDVRIRPIGDLWAPFPRLVRNLAEASGKPVCLHLSGGSTYVDKAILEALREPLTHVIRNAIDHGIEPSEIRRDRGKPTEGTISINAHYDDVKIIIEVSDDGGGVDVEAVRTTAIAQGVVTARAAAKMRRRDVLDLVFAPGLSTAGRVTKTSGRGVGMDAVRSQIEGVGGSVEMQTEPGLGATVRINIPLTLAVAPAIVVVSRGQRFAIPQLGFIESIELDAFPTNPAERPTACSHRDALLPLVFLDDLCHHPRPVYDPRDRPVLVLSANGRRFGLVVDAVIGSEEIVTRRFGETVNASEFLLGSTIIADGSTALIVDSVGVAERAGFIHRRRRHQVEVKAA